LIENTAESPAGSIEPGSERDENSSGRQPAYEFDNSPVRANWTPAPGAGGPEPFGRGMRREAPNTNAAVRSR